MPTTYLVQDTELTSIANAIRSKTGTSSSMAFPSAFVSAIDSIETGGGVDNLPSFVRNHGTVRSYFNSTIDRVGLGAFAYCYSLSAVSMPACLSISSFAFINCYNLETINIPSVGWIGKSAFYSCAKLSEVSLPNCSFIDHEAYKYCSSLTTISSPSLSTVRSSVFEGCTNLISAYLPSASIIGYGAFSSCYNMTSIYAPSCVVIDGYAFTNCKSMVSYNFPLCTSIGKGAFSSNTALEEVSFPSCNIISSYAFYNCTSLVSAYFPIVSIVSSSAFMNCMNLSYVQIDNCQIIRSAAFYGCSALSTLHLSSCSLIQTSAFRGCTNLISLYLYSTSMAELDATALFAFVDSPMVSSGNGIIYVPLSLISQYRADSNWSGLSSHIFVIPPHNPLSGRTFIFNDVLTVPADDILVMGEDPMSSDLIEDRNGDRYYMLEVTRNPFNGNLDSIAFGQTTVYTAANGWVNDSYKTITFLQEPDSSWDDGAEAWFLSVTTEDI